MVGDSLRDAIREAARQAFGAVRSANPREYFYYFALVTTGDALRPGPSACSLEGLERVLDRYRAKGSTYGADVLRWSEADSPYHLHGDEHFRDVEALFRCEGDHRTLPDATYEEEVARRFQAMEDALRELDREGVFGTGAKRHGVVINVVAPGEEDEDAILVRAARLNPAESLVQLRRDLGA
jgi:hypothetical protein